MKRCSYCGAEYPDDVVVCALDQTPFEPGNPEIYSTPGQRRFFAYFGAVFFLTVLSSVLMAFLAPEKFRSTAQFVVEWPDTRTERFSGSHFAQTEFGIIKSHAVLSRAVQALNLREVWGKKYNRGAPLSSDRAESILKRNIEVSLVQNTRLIEIHALSPDPNESAQLANGVVDAYRDYKGYLPGNDFNPGTRAVTIISTATPEPHSCRPNRRLIIVLGVMIGIVFALIAGMVSVRKGPHLDGDAQLI